MLSVPAATVWYFASSDGNTSCAIMTDSVQCDSPANGWKLERDDSCRYNYGFGVKLANGEVTIACANDTVFNLAEVGAAGTSWHIDEMPRIESSGGLMFAVLPAGHQIKAGAVTCEPEDEKIRCSRGDAWFLVSAKELTGTLPS